MVPVRVREVVVDAGGHDACEQIVKGLVVVDPDAPLACVLVFIDVDLGDERLVEQSPGGIVGFQAAWQSRVRSSTSARN